MKPLLLIAAAEMYFMTTPGGIAFNIRLAFSFFVCAETPPDITNTYNRIMTQVLVAEYKFGLRINGIKFPHFHSYFRHFMIT